jgi:hypothetical protein
LEGLNQATSEIELHTESDYCLNKKEVARRQLGTALALYLNDNDPVAVHCLACGGGEIAEFLTRQAKQKPFIEHIIATFPERKAREIRILRNQYWNAFKHATDKEGNKREDLTLLAQFTDEQNDHALFIGWYDYMLAVGALPIEAQAHQTWYFAKYPEKLNQGVDKDRYEKLFPNIGKLPRAEQKQRLCEAIKCARQDDAVMHHIGTDPRPLILR